MRTLTTITIYFGGVKVMRFRVEPGMTGQSRTLWALSDVNGSGRA